jgi:hypothetical protein
MNATLTDLIARHHPDKDEASRLTAALATVIEAAGEHLADLEAGVADHTYDAEENRNAIASLAAALAALED